MKLVSANRQVGHIRAEPELKFMLLRHWTLFDSINNSNYMVAKLGLWREPGKKELRDFFAHLGCSIDQAQQKFNFMDSDIKESLKGKITDLCERFNLDDIIMHSYVRQFDSKTQISASDIAYSISSLLEHPNITGQAKEVDPDNVDPNLQRNSDPSKMTA